MATAMRSFCSRWFPISCDERISCLSQPSSSLCFSANFSNGFFSKGCLSLDISRRANRNPVICMARRYAPNTTKRKRLSRKRGGDPEKKRHRNRKGSRKKKLFKIVRLVSEAGTGFFYATRKSRKLDKLVLKKYDPKVRQHVLFTEAK